MAIPATMQCEQFVEWGVVGGASLTAALYDMRTGRIPNLVTVTLALAGLILATLYAGVRGLGEAASVWIVLALPYIVLFALGQGGAGDAKMMGAIGVWLGLRQGVVVLCCVAIVGGVLSILRVLSHAERWTVLRNLMISLYVSLLAFAGGTRGWNLLKTEPQEGVGQDPQQVTIPYGVAIFLGVCLGAVVVHL